MKLLYAMIGLMLVGAILMFVSSYQIFDKMAAVKTGDVGPDEAKATMRPYVTMSYLGLALFVIAGVGGVILVITIVTRRF
jgi:hypothetical protein